MENNEIELNDLSNDLLVINKITIERLFSLKDDNALVLYLFYYKTAKWQGTNQVFATDSYIRKCLNWGSNKVTNAKNTLKNAGLIEIIQKRENNKISGWYIKVKYLENSKNTRKQELQNATSCNQETNALKEYIKCLENKIEILNKEIDNNKLLSTKKNFNPPTIEEIENYCKEKKYDINVQDFYDYYNENNWIDSKGNKVKSWKQRVVTWNSRNRNNNNTKKSFSEMLDEL